MTHGLSIFISKAQFNLEPPTTEAPTTVTTLPPIDDSIFNHGSQNYRVGRFGFLPGPYKLDGLDAEILCTRNFGYGWRAVTADDDHDMLARILAHNNDNGNYQDYTAEEVSVACFNGIYSIEDETQDEKAWAMFYCDLGAIGLMDKVGKNWRDTKYNLKNCAAQKRAPGNPRNMFIRNKGQLQLNCTDCRKWKTREFSAVECDISCKIDKKGNKLTAKFRCEPVRDENGKVIGARNVYDPAGFGRYQEICGAGCPMSTISNYMGSTTSGVFQKPCSKRDSHNPTNYIPKSRCKFECESNSAYSTTTKEKTGKPLTCTCKTEDDVRKCKWTINNSKDIDAKNWKGYIMELFFAEPKRCKP